MAVPAAAWCPRDRYPRDRSWLSLRPLLVESSTCHQAGKRSEYVDEWRTAATRRTSPSATTPRNEEAQPAPSRWASLAAWSRHPAAAGLALCGMVAVSYYPALFGGFVIDDHIFADSPAVHAWSGLWNIWFSPDGRRGGRALLAGPVHDVLAGAQALGSRAVRISPGQCAVVHGQRPVAVGACCDGSPCRAPGPWPRYSQSIRCMSIRWPGSSDAKTCSPDSSAWPRHCAGCVPRLPLVTAGRIPADDLFAIFLVALGSPDSLHVAASRTSILLRRDCSQPPCCPSRWRSPCRWLSRSCSGGNRDE